MAVGSTDARAKLQLKLRELGATQPDRSASEPHVTVTLAAARIDLDAAAFLLESLYAAHGYRVSRLDPRSGLDLILVARQRGEAVGTLTLRADGPAGLRADESYGDELAAARALGRRACEFSRFAVAGNAAAIRALFGFAYQIVREVWESTDVFIEVNPVTWRSIAACSVSPSLRGSGRARGSSRLRCSCDSRSPRSRRGSARPAVAR